MNATAPLLPLLLLILATLPSLVHGATRQLNLFIWSEYIDPTLVAEFEQLHDCKVTIDLYDDDAAMMAKLRSGGDSLYDVVVPPDHKVPLLIKLGLLAPLRHENIPNLKNLEDRFRSPPFDPGNRYTAAYLWGTTGIFIRRSPGPTPEATWALLFDPRRQPGTFVLIDNARDLIGIALKYLGHSLNSTHPPHLKAARDLILEAKSRCAGFDNSVGAKRPGRPRRHRLQRRGRPRHGRRPRHALPPPPRRQPNLARQPRHPRPRPSPRHRRTLP